MTDLSVVGQSSCGRVFGQEVELDGDQLLTGCAVARLPDQLQLADADRQVRAHAAHDEELADRQRRPGGRGGRGGGRRGRLGGGRAALTVCERPVERVRTVVAARRPAELPQHPTDSVATLDVTSANNIN